MNNILNESEAAFILSIEGRCPSKKCIAHFEKKWNVCLTEELLQGAREFPSVDEALAFFYKGKDFIGELLFADEENDTYVSFPLSDAERGRDPLFCYKKTYSKMEFVCRKQLKK